MQTAFKQIKFISATRTNLMLQATLKKCSNMRIMAFFLGLLLFLVLRRSMLHGDQLKDARCDALMGGWQVDVKGGLKCVKP